MTTLGRRQFLIHTTATAATLAAVPGITGRFAQLFNTDTESATQQTKLFPNLLMLPVVTLAG